MPANTIPIWESSAALDRQDSSKGTVVSRECYKIAPNKPADSRSQPERAQQAPSSFPLLIAPQIESCSDAGFTHLWVFGCPDSVCVSLESRLGLGHPGVETSSV